MKPGMFIRHKNAMDVCYQVKTAFDYGHGYAITAETFNMAFVETFSLGLLSRQRINFSKVPGWDTKAHKVYLKDWEFLAKGPGQNCLRYAKWKGF